MDRRGFLTTLAAACTALTSARALAKSPTVSVAANTGGFRRTLSSAQQRVLDLLKGCEVVSVEQISSVSRPPAWKTIYRHAPKKPRGELAPQADQIAATCTPATMTVMTSTKPIPGHLGSYSPLYEPVQEIVIEWYA